ncbi:PRC-barrel domain-containing protein [Neolewinella agarilytica]|uniref:PRC-barrel domain-containing protein n=1 Tax=Neolewinella agarilytica TaxID=478744 RepID=A0A1H9INY8_9BACT|nr:PRC-barrel domain-containing protein [Neolewinella agarilytica]SEQ76266.1 PRC-barrel domain-containing protein [Neolewinella agarilytica]
MHNLIFSVSSLLHCELYTPEGLNIGTLHDVVCNKDSGKITYLIVETCSPDHLFAIHHSFFYLGQEEDEIIFDQRIGRENHAIYLDLPGHYASKTVLKYRDFLQLILPNLAVAGHRSDNETLF